MTWTRLGLRLRPPARGDDARPFVGDLVAVARAAERAGYDTLWLPAAVPGPISDAGALDPFVTAAALVPATGSIRLGCLDHPVESRAPAMLAKAVASLDVLSGGRAAVGIAVPEDAGAAGEALRIVRSMLTQDAPSFRGHRFHVDAAWNEPRRRDGSPPLVVSLGAAALESGLLEYADGCVLAGAGPGQPAAAAAAAAAAGAARGGFAVVALLRAGGGLWGAASESLDAGCNAVVVEVTAGAGARERVEHAAAQLAPLLLG